MRFHLCVSAFLIAFVLANRGEAQVVTTIAVAEDTWISGLNSTETLGADDRLGICPTAKYQIYLKFDLTAAPDGVTGAELRMKRIDGSRPEEISLFFISDDTWTEATLDGPSRPDPQSPADEDEIARGEAAEGFDRWVSEQLTEAIRQEAAGDGVISLMLRENSGPTDVRHYFSKEGVQDPADAPRLAIETASGEIVDSGWEVVEIGIGTKPAFDFGPDGKIHIMAMTESFDGIVWYASADLPAGPWEPATVAEGYFYGPGDLLVGSDGTAHVAWHNHDTENAEHATVTPDGITTRFEIDTPGSHDGWDNSLALDAQGGLHQASVDPVGFGATESLQYSVFDGAGWTLGSIAEAGAFMYASGTAIAIDSQGDTHIVFCDATEFRSVSDLKYAVRRSGEWEVSSIVTGGIRGRFPSLQLDHWDRPHVAWLDADESDPNLGFIRYAVFNGGVWEVETIDTLTNIELSFAEARKSISLALDAIFRPHVAYNDKRTLRYAYKPFSDWEITTALESAADRYQGLVVMRLDAQDRPGLIFWERHETEDGLVRFAAPKTPATARYWSLYAD